MTLDQQHTIAQQLERAAEIMRSDATTPEKINTLKKIGDICTFHSEKWGDAEFMKMVDSLAVQS